MIDAAVVGAGPAGLAASLALAGRGVEHVVLERDRVAGTGRPSAGTPSGSTPPDGSTRCWAGRRATPTPAAVRSSSGSSGSPPAARSARASGSPGSPPRATAGPSPPTTHVALDPPAALDLAAEEITGVVWCTGFTGDFSWLDPALAGAGGQPLHDDGAAPAPGLWYLGLRWLRRRCSGIMLGFPGDAARVAGAVRAHLGG